MIKIKPKVESSSVILDFEVYQLKNDLPLRKARDANFVFRCPCCKKWLWKLKVLKNTIRIVILVKQWVTEKRKGVIDAW